MKTPREIQAAVYAAAGARDWDTVESLLHDDFVLCEMGEFEDGLMKSLRIHYFDAAQVAEKAAS